MAYQNNRQRRAATDAMHAAVDLLSPDERLMTMQVVAAEIIAANYPETAHELLAAMAQHGVFDFLLAISIERDLERNSSLRRTA